MPHSVGHLRSIVTRDGAVILDLERDTLLHLNSTGGMIWQQLGQGRSIDEVAAALAAETEIDLRILDQDIRAFCDQLRAKRLLAS
jgi:hypothetical protein